jgi:hypothetical protein
MRLWYIAAGLAAACTTPLHLASGAAFSRAGVRPRLELSGGLEGAVWTDRHEHEALWLGSTVAYALTPDSKQVFVGPEIQLSRLRNPHLAGRSLDVLCLRPELGWASFRALERQPRFLGASAEWIHSIRAVPFTLAVRAGRFDSGPDRGFYTSILLGVVASSSLYWMQ